MHSFVFCGALAACSAPKPQPESNAFLAAAVRPTHSVSQTPDSLRSLQFTMTNDQAFSDSVTSNLHPHGHPLSPWRQQDMLWHCCRCKVSHGKFLTAAAGNDIKRHRMIQGPRTASQHSLRLLNCDASIHGNSCCGTAVPRLQLLMALEFAILPVSSRRLSGRGNRTVQTAGVAWRQL